MPNSTGAHVALPTGLESLSDDLSLIICDLWGVMHDGVQPHGDAIAAIRQARAAGIPTVFLSNAPRPRGYVRDHLRQMGVPGDLTDLVVTSGGLARDEVREKYAGARLYHMGPEFDRNTIAGLPVDEVGSISDAEIILATDLDFTSVEAHRPMLRAAAERGVPFLCANPDRVVHVGEKLYLCAGAVADLYAELGGDVHWFGKPEASALWACPKEAGLDRAALDPARVMMIGDSLQTDIAGARAAGYRGLLISGGIHRDDMPRLFARAEGQVLPVQAFTDVMGAGKAVPHAILNRLVW